MPELKKSNLLAFGGFGRYVTEYTGSFWGTGVPGVSGILKVLGVLGILYVIGTRTGCHFCTMSNFGFY